MTQTTSDHGALHYIELIKCPAPDEWRVSILKSEGGDRSVTYCETGDGLFNVLEKAHRKSAEMLSKFLSENPDDPAAYVSRKKADTKAKAKAKPAPAVPEKEKTKETKKETPEGNNLLSEVIAAALGPTPAGTSLLSLMGYDPESDFVQQMANYEKNYMMPGFMPGFMPGHMPGYMPGYLYASDPTQETVSIDSDSSLRSRSIVCPNYGPASAFYRVTPSYGLERMNNESESTNGSKAAEKNKPEPVKPALTPVAALVATPVAALTPAAPTPAAPAPSTPAAPAPSTEAVKTQARGKDKGKEKAQSEGPSDIVRMQMENQKGRRHVPPSSTFRSVLLFIRWPGYGETVVADECQLSMRAVQSRVRHMLRTHGAGLFGDKTAIPPAPFTADGLAKFTVTVKTLTVNDQVVVLGPSFGDDIAVVANGSDKSKAIKIEIELTWNAQSFADLVNMRTAGL
ncbi:hypothetical protein TrVFT333_008995 [Trichoderma virens FT-333]|nr:hypothetical protein TrVFT333_008995 [Trichoderma virens FT-333]